jgi:hypothetical protein
MTEHIVAIAPIPLTRSIGRMLAVPALLLIAGVVAVTGGANVGGLVGIGLVAAGLVVAGLSLYLAVMLLTVRLDVQVATLRLRWLGGERRYTLVRGPVTRVALAGDEAARLRPRFGAFGWAVGRAKLRGDEMIDLVRLAPTASMILVPTDRGRLGIAPASEENLLSALAAAARIQQRLDDVAERARAFMDLPATSDAPTPEVDSRPVVAAPGGRRMLTGIERQLLEERLTSERAAALHRAEAERSAAIHAAEVAAMAMPAAEAAPVPAAQQVMTTLPDRRLRRWRLAEWIAARRPAKPTAGEVAAAAATMDAVEAVSAPEPIQAVAPVPIAEPMAVVEPLPIAEPIAAAEAPAVADAPARPAVRNDQLLAFGLALTPVIGAGVIWLIAYIRGDLGLSVEELRPIALALLAVGPAGALAALAARAWYPRLQGLVTVTALTALLLVGRVLLG